MNVQFEENNFTPRNYGVNTTPKFAAWLISKGLAKDEKGANVIQIICSLVFFGLAIFFFIK
ncbi:MAG TPA: hypothetical protein VIR98_00210 [Candidatus Paceibacterota bacterium]|jgi:hypothetical protein